MRSPTPILHVDMDAFFAAVELVRRPDLRGRPVVVGGTGERGVVAAASYEARVFGIRSAMSTARALQLCPYTVFLPADHAHYGEVSGRVMDIFRRFTPLVEPLSLDEAFLDVGGVGRIHGAPEDVASEIRSTVEKEEQLTCSVGVAPNKFLAKLASEQAKPRIGGKGAEPGTGVCVVAADGVDAFLGSLPVGLVWGVGPRTLERLHRLGVSSVGDLAGLPEGALVAALGASAGRQLWRLARGIDDRPVDPNQAAKSISHEETFSRDLFRPDDLRHELGRMVNAVTGRARESGVAARTITLKVRFADFTTITRSSTLGGATDSGAEVAEVAADMLEQLDLSPGVRLLGLSLTGLQDGAYRQLRLDDATGSGSGPDWGRAEGVIDRIRLRFGDSAIGRAAARRTDGT